MCIDALDGHAHLAAIHERGEEELGRHRFHVHIIEYDRGIVATELERDALEIARSACHHFLARLNGSGEGDLVDAGMLGHPLTEFIAARENVHDTATERLRAPARRP